MLTHLVRLITVSTFILLQACSGPGKGGGGFPSDSEKPKVLGTDPVETVGVIIEANGNPVSSPITIVALNYDFKEISGTPASVPDYVVVPRSAGGYTIQFGDTYVEQINVVIKARFTNGKVLYAPLHSLNNQNDAITVSHKSDYVLRKLFDTIDSIEELNKHLPCASGLIDCPSQVLAKAFLLFQTNRTAQEYEIDIPDNSSFSEVYTLLDQTLDFRNHIETAINEITRIDEITQEASPIAKGTRRDWPVNFSNPNLIYSQEYNSVWFGLSFSNDMPGNSQNEVKIASASSVIVPAPDDRNLPSYPYYSQTISLQDVHKENYYSDIPFTRTTLSIDEIDNVIRDIQEPVNSFSSLPVNGYVSTEGFLLDNRVIEPAFTNKSTGSGDIEWQFNPLFSKLYRANDYEREHTQDAGVPDTPVYDADPTWLISANYSSGATYESKDSGRGGQLEAINLFTWEIHGLETDTSFSADVIDDKTFGVISYSLKLDDEDDRLTLYGETLRWRAANKEMVETQPNAHYQTYTLRRDKDNVVSGVTEGASINLNDHGFDALTTRKSTTANPTAEPENLGLITMDGGTNAPYGHSSQNGKHLAIAINSLDRGRGLMIATQLRSSATPTFSGERYQLQGNSFGMTSTTNRLQNFYNSTLTLNDREDSDPAEIDCRADLKVTVTRLDHTVGVDDNTLSPVTRTTETTQSSSACRLEGSEIELTFDAIVIDSVPDDILGQALTLRGFVTRQGEDSASDSTPGKLITFLWKQSDAIGLVFANLEQSLSASFDP